MIIPYATRHRWLKFVSANILGDFGRNDKARLSATLRDVENTAVSWQCLPLDHTFLDAFMPLYEERIQEKRHPALYDIRQHTMGEGRRQYYRLSLEEHGALLGAIIFSERRNALSIAYRTFRKRWVSAKMRAGPSLYAEYLIARYAQERGMHTIIHGRDRNPYGLYSDIGLAAFKLSVGCVPQLSRTSEVCMLDTDVFAEDVFVFEYPGNKTDIITRAYLITKPENEARWQRVTMYPERIKVTTIYR